MMRVILASLAACLGLAAQESPKLFYSKSFPGSVPPYMEVQLNNKGEVEYREQAGEAAPVTFKLSAGETAGIFGLADKLGHFDRKLESGLPVARMGEKTFRWSRGGQVREQKFNYTQDPDAQELQDLFEKICESAARFIDLERTAQFDKLGVNRSLLLLEAAWDRGRLNGLEMFLPLLDKIARQSAYLNMARERAEKLATVFRNPPPKSDAKEDSQPK
ncbi:MAG TPA: hypothetical protein PKJ41_04800 [Bryobacteraceae bacterium]|nr:hypothetical protein [Bryobacteraceae bacterium]HPT25567.1 hypothetical protein [Bryobacteraceae bacterium]